MKENRKFLNGLFLIPLILLAINIFIALNSPAHEEAKENSHAEKAVEQSSVITVEE